MGERETERRIAGGSGRPAAAVQGPSEGKVPHQGTPERATVAPASATAAGGWELGARSGDIQTAGPTQVARGVAIKSVRSQQGEDRSTTNTTMRGHHRGRRKTGVGPEGGRAGRRSWSRGRGRSEARRGAILLNKKSHSGSITVVGADCVRDDRCHEGGDVKGRGIAPDITGARPNTKDRAFAKEQSWNDAPPPAPAPQAATRTAVHAAPEEGPASRGMMYS